MRDQAALTERGQLRLTTSTPYRLRSNPAERTVNFHALPDRGEAVRGVVVEHSNAADGLACDPVPPTPLSRRPYGAERPFPERVLLAWAAADWYVIWSGL